jgi:transcriptional regulator with XRE-family HTH domain
MSENNKSQNNVVPLTGKSGSRAQAAARNVKKSRRNAVQPLLRALSNRAHELGDDSHEMSAALGVTYGYILQLEHGNRPMNTISDDFAFACAQYLEVPRLQVLRMAGRIKPEDFFSGADVYRQQVERALRFIEADPVWSTVLTAEMRASSPDTLFEVIRLYEVATGTVLMPKRQAAASVQTVERPVTQSD